jgi:hypothetical protein
MLTPHNAIPIPMTAIGSRHARIVARDGVYCFGSILLLAVLAEMYWELILQYVGWMHYTAPV